MKSYLLSLWALALSASSSAVTASTRQTSVPSSSLYANPRFEGHVKLETFYISDAHLPTHESRVAMGKRIVTAIQRDGIINIAVDGICSPRVITDAYKAHKGFFDRPVSDKMKFANDLSYAGYVYSGEEETAGKRDAAEIFTITPGFDLESKEVKMGLPCHGPVPWPCKTFETALTTYGNAMRDVGDRVLPLIALGLGMPENAFDDLTSDSWGHMRVLKFRERESTDLKGIGSHTDYGMLVLASQDHVGGLWVRPHANREQRKNNWQETSAGDYENDEGWKFVVPEPNVLTCFPGDMLQFITKGKLMSTPHKVELADETRYAIAYFHEPSFGAVIQVDGDESVHYGEHFTNMFKRCYPLKPVTLSMLANNLEANLPRSKTGWFKF